VTRALSFPGLLISPSRCFDYRLPRLSPGLTCPSHDPHPHPHQDASKLALTPLLPHLHLLEAPHAVQDVKLLPALGKVHFAVNVIRVSQVNKGQVLQNQASEGEKGAAGQGVGKQVQRLVTQGSQKAARRHLTASHCSHHQHGNCKLEGNVPPAADPKVLGCKVPATHNWGTPGHAQGTRLLFHPPWKGPGWKQVVMGVTCRG